MTNLLELVETVLARKGISAHAASKMAGYPSLIKNMRDGRQTSFERAMKLLEVLQVPVHIGVDLEPPSPMASPATAIPAVGMAACDARGWAERQTTRIRARPPFHLTDPAAFAVFAGGDHMRPAGIYPGAVCFCSPAAIPGPDDIVCIQRRRTADGPVGLGIKMLRVRCRDTVEVAGYGPIQARPDGSMYQDMITDTVPESEIVGLATVLYIATRPNINV